MVGFAWLLTLLALALSADCAWASFRDWRTRRTAIKTGPTLTRKFDYPWA